MTTDNSKYSIDDYIKDALAEKYEKKAIRMIRTVLDDGTLIIGKNRYDALKKIPKDSLVRKQAQEIKDFEDYHGITEYVQKLKEQHRQIEKKIEDRQSKMLKARQSVNADSVWNIFLRYFKKFEKKEFQVNESTMHNITPIVYYFAKDKRFLKYGVKDANGNFLSKPSLNKGLCIVGGFGNGKTSIMNNMQRIFIGLDGYSFGRFSSHEIVQKYESASKHGSPEILERLWTMLTRSELYIDDVKAEGMTFAFGKKNTINTLLQDRYNKKLKTHISINFAPGYNGDVLKALEEFKTKYSNQVYDRIYEMFNIIEFKGKSFRGH